MSPPDANIEKQKRRHWPVIWAIVGAVALAIVTWLALLPDDTRDAIAPSATEGDVAD